MPRARLYFNGDNIYTKKVKRVHKLTEEVEAKIDWIPWVVNDATSTSETDALSANMGKVLQDQINELKSMWRFLSTWDCTTWTPATDPVDDPYDYRTGDYYIVSRIGDTNYRPHWTIYTAWVASSTVETAIVNVNDWYLFDWTSWVLQNQSQITISIDTALSTTSTNAVENRVVANTLNNKQNTISDLATIRSWAAAGATAIQPWDNISELTNNSWYQTAWDVANAISGKADSTAVSALTTRVSTAEWTISSLQTDVSALQQSSWWTATDVSDLQSDVSDIQADISSIQTALSSKVDSSSLATVATTGKTSDLTNDAWFITASYIWDGQITLAQWWVNKWAFTLNQAGSTTVSLETVKIMSEADYTALATKDPDVTYLITNWAQADTTGVEYISVENAQALVSDTAYWSGWDWDTTHAPSKNAVYDAISALSTSNSSSASVFKIFTLNGTSDLTNWQAIVDWILAGKMAVIQWPLSGSVLNRFYWLDRYTEDYALFYRIPFAVSSNGTFSYMAIELDYTNGVITQIRDRDDAAFKATLIDS